MGNKMMILTEIASKPLTLVIVFIIATVVGYLLIKQIPSLLHTPLMSGMNALSGLTILGALTIFAVLLKEVNELLAIIIGGLAVVLAMVNVVGGFGITHRMLQMFRKKEDSQ